MSPPIRYAAMLTVLLALTSPAARAADATPAGGSMTAGTAAHDVGHGAKDAAHHAGPAVVDSGHAIVHGAAAVGHAAVNGARDFGNGLMHLPATIRGAFHSRAGGG